MAPRGPPQKVPFWDLKMAFPRLPISALCKGQPVRKLRRQKGCDAELAISKRGDLRFHLSVPQERGWR